MYCSQCGKKIPGNARYCSGCGTRQDMGIVPAEEPVSGKESDREKERQKAHRRGRRFGNFLVSMIALLVLFAGDKEVPNAVDDILQQTDAVCFTVRNQKEMVICDEKGTVCVTDIPQKMLYSGDHRRMAYIDRDNELYYMEDMTPVFIDDDVRTARWSFYGDTIVYVRDGDGVRSEFCIYTAKTQEAQRMEVAGCSVYAVSPNGKTAACVEEGGDGTLYLRYPDGQVAEISENVSEIFALADNSKSILFRQDEDRLFLYMDHEEKKLGSINGNISLMLNASQDEILYSEEGSTWYYSAEYDEPVRLTGVKGKVSASCCMADIACQQENGLILGRKTLKNMIFAVDDPDGRSCKIYHLDRTGERAELIFNHADQFQIAKDGRSLLCLSDRKLYYIKNISVSQNKICLSNTMDVCQFAADPGLDRIWFATPDHELYSVKNEECVSLSHELTQMQGFCMDGVLFLEGRDLYLADREEKLLLIENVDGVSIQENRYAVVEADNEFLYIKDLNQTVSLMSNR